MLLYYKLLSVNVYYTPSPAILIFLVHSTWTPFYCPGQPPATYARSASRSPPSRCQHHKLFLRLQWRRGKVS